MQKHVECKPADGFETGMNMPMWKGLLDGQKTPDRGKHLSAGKDPEVDDVVVGLIDLSGENGF